MKKKFYLSALFSAILLNLFTACSNDDNIDNKQTVDVAKQITFKMDFIDYNAGDSIEGNTRAAHTEPVKKQIIPMGNFFAEVSMKRDTTKASAKEQAAATRALADGNYHVYAYQGTVLKNMMTGTMASNTFTPTGSADGMSLEPGTYTFICVNDGVDVSGSLWKVSQTNIENARIGVAENVNITASPKHQKVTFAMKHVGCRIRPEIYAEGYMALGIQATLSSVNNIPQQVMFDPTTRTYSYGSTAPFTININNDNAYSNMWPRKYFYICPGAKIADFKMTLNSGMGFNIPITTKRTWTFTDQTAMKENGSYILYVILKYNYIYLYSDGTTGQYTDADFSSHTPVGMVVSRSKRLAIALKDAAHWNVAGGTAYPWSTLNVRSNPNASSVLNNHLNDFNGEDYSYSSTYAHNGTLRADDATNFPAFHKAATYDAGVPLTGTIASHKWFLPTMADWNLYVKNLRLSNNLFAEPWTDTKSTADEYGFRRGGGDPLYYAEISGGPTDPGFAYWGGYMSASESSTTDFFYMNIKVGASRPNPFASYWAFYYSLEGAPTSDKNVTFGSYHSFSFAAIRPFIHY